MLKWMQLKSVIVNSCVIIVVLIKCIPILAYQESVKVDATEESYS